MEAVKGSGKGMIVVRAAARFAPGAGHRALADAPMQAPDQGRAFTASLPVQAAAACSWLCSAHVRHIACRSIGLVRRSEAELSPQDEVELMTHYGTPEALAEARARLARWQAKQG